MDRSLKQKQQYPQQPHPKILIQHLQSKLTASQDSSIHNQTPNNIGQNPNASSSSNNNNGNGEWMLSQDDQLATTLHSISRYMRQRIQQVSQSIEELEQKQMKLSNLVSLENTSLLLRNDVQFVENRAYEDDDGEEGDTFVVVEENGMLRKGGDVSVSMNHEEEQLHKVITPTNNLDTKSIASELSSVGNHPHHDDVLVNHEEDVDDINANLIDNAIENGMRALSLFLDPALPQPLRRIGSANDANTHSNTAILDSCYYYDSVEEDEFNHRPLPYVVGSVEFLDSVTAGLGGMEEELKYDEHREKEEQLKQHLNQSQNHAQQLQDQQQQPQQHQQSSNQDHLTSKTPTDNPFRDEPIEDTSVASSPPKQIGVKSSRIFQSNRNSSTKTPSITLQSNPPTYSPNAENPFAHHDNESHDGKILNTQIKQKHQDYMTLQKTPSNISISSFAASSLTTNMTTMRNFESNPNIGGGTGGGDTFYDANNNHHQQHLQDQEINSKGEETKTYIAEDDDEDDENLERTTQPTFSSSSTHETSNLERRNGNQYHHYPTNDLKDSQQPLYNKSDASVQNMNEGNDNPSDLFGYEDDSTRNTETESIYSKNRFHLFG